MIKTVEGILWAFAVIFIVRCGIYYTFKLRFVQFKFKYMLKNIFKKTNGISFFDSLMLSLGGRIGVGSIAGISIAIYLGGIGTVFWIWLIGLICAPNAFAETVLGIKYQSTGLFGGPSYYISKGLGLKRLGKIYSYLILFSYIFGFSSIQSNTIAVSLNTSFNLSGIHVGLIIGVLTIIIITGGVKKIANVSKYLVPFMIFIYVGTALLIIFKNITIIPHLLISIVNNALNIRSFGIGVLSTFIIGIQRGVFATEAGLGTGAIASSVVKTKYPAECGFVQMIGIYITTFLVCTSTALIILLSDSSVTMLNGIEAVYVSFVDQLGNFGNWVVMVSILLFAFSTILTGYYNGESALKSLEYSDNKILSLKYITFIIIVLGSICKANILWRIIDIMVALLAIINSYALFKLKDEVIYEYKRYNKCDTIN